MRNLTRAWICIGLVCCAGITAIGSSSAQTQTGPDIAVLVNPGNSVGNLSVVELRKIFRGERQYWSADSPILLLMRPPGTAERNVILRSVLQMSEAQYTQYWVGKIMRAEAAYPPAAVFSYTMVMEGVRGNQGAIGYVSASQVPAGLKVLQIDGVLPGQPGYPLR
jgi:ABC-type phosphate transport system substrate-binding protein